MVSSAPTASDEDDGKAAREVTSTRKKLEDDPLIGRVLDARYRIEGVLGAGGVGVVYRAVHTGLRRPVALKVLRHGFEELASLRRRFEREARILSQLNHPNIVGLTDYGICDDMPYLVMELLEGRSLADLIDEDGPPDPAVALDIVRGIVRGLAFAHGRSVLHRDLKPGNVFLQALPDEPHHPKLLDFGLAKIYADEEGAEDEPTLTKAGTIIGTPAYMAPEQAAGSAVDARADVYAAGVLLFELLTGRPPFMEERRSDLFRSHMVDPVPDPASFRAGLMLHDDLQALLLRALEKEPADRYADGSELLAAFDALPIGAARIESGVEEPTGSRSLVDARRAEPAPSPSRVPLYAGLAVLLLLAGLALWWRGQDEEPAPAPEPDQVVTLPETSVTPVTPEVVTAPDPVPTPPEPAPDPDPGGEERFAIGDDPFAAPLPAELARLAQRLEGGDSLDREAHRAMRIYQRLHPDDPRPSLLLGRDFVRHNAWPQAIERYELSLVRGDSARGDPQMFEDLLEAVRSDRNGDEAGDAIARIYGAEAVEPVRVELARSETRPIRQRLRALLRKLQ